MTPIYYTSTYAQNAPGEHKGFEYSRTHNLHALRARGQPRLARGRRRRPVLRVGPRRDRRRCSQLFDAGTHVVACDDLYGGTFRLFDKVYRRLGFEFTYVDPLGGAAAVEAAIRPNTKLVWVETPTNPMLKLVDIAAVADGVQEARASCSPSTTRS